MKKNDGGPAFPWTDPNEQNGLPPQSAGMSLRDYFAAAAMQAIRSRNPRVFDATRTPKNVRYLAAEEAAKMAYEDADAMLAEREKEQP